MQSLARTHTLPMAVPCFWIRIQTLQCLSAIWSAEDNSEGPFLTQKGWLSFVCGRRHLLAQSP